MDDVAEQLNLLKPADFAAVTVAVQSFRARWEHRVFCIFLLTRLQFLDGPFILLLNRALHRSRDGVNFGDPIADQQLRLRTGAKQPSISIIEIIEKRAWIDAPQGAIDLKSSPVKACSKCRE